MTLTQLGDRIEARIRDSLNNTFSAAVILDGIRYGLRATWPKVYKVVKVPCGTGTYVAGTESIDLATDAAGADDDAFRGTGAVRFSHAEYKTPRGWVAFKGARIFDSTLEFSEPLTQAREVRVIMLQPVWDGSALTGDSVLPGPVGFDEIVEPFAIAWILEGYLAGRISYDKYTVTSADDAVASYEVSQAARDFRALAETRLADFAGAGLAVRTR